MGYLWKCLIVTYEVLKSNSIFWYFRAIYQIHQYLLFISGAVEGTSVHKLYASLSKIPSPTQDIWLATENAYLLTLEGESIAFSIASSSFSFQFY